MLPYKAIISNVFLFFLMGTSLAQPLAFDHLSTYDGLSQNSVLCITQDYRGFMWFGTAHGLNRYDGTGFKKYLADSTDKNAIVNDYINSILADSKKTLWVGTSEGLNKINLETNKIDKIPVSGSENGISDRAISCLYEDREGNIWVGTFNGLNLLTDRNKNSFTKFYADNTSGIAGNYIRCIFEDDEGSLWIGTSNGLTRMTKKNDTYQFETFRNIQDNKKFLSNNIISAIGQDVEHNIWVGTPNEGLSVFNKRTGIFTEVVMRGVPSKTVRTIKNGPDGKLWIGALEGIFILDVLSKSDTIYQHSSSQPKSLSQNSVYSIYHDMAGSVWVGTYFGGINVSHRYLNTFSIWQNDNTKNSISNDVVSGITEDEKQNLWLSTEGGGLNYIDRKTGKISWYKHDKENPGSLGSNKVKTVYRDPQGNIWAGTTGGGLNLFNPSSGTFSHFVFDPANPATSSSEIICLLEDSQQRFWVGTQHGLKLFRKINNTLVQDTSEVISGSLSVDYINTIIEDSHNNIWVGAYQHLFILKKNEPAFTVINSLGKVINCLYEDKDGNFWAGIFYGGLVKYIPSTGKVIRYAIENTVPGNQVLSIHGDDHNNLWLATDIGLCRFNLNDNSFRIFNPGDGIVVGGNVKNSFYKGRSGEFFFGGQNGLCSFFPDKIQLNNNIAPLVFTSLRLFNNLAEVNANDGLLVKDLSLTDKIQFRSNQNMFTISFALLSYIKPEKNTYLYKLEGLDKDWNQSKNTFITYTYLPPGKYTLLVKAANSDGIWSKPVSLHIEILPPAGKTWWAYLIYFSVFALIVFFILRYFFLRALRKAKQQSALSN